MAPTPTNVKAPESFIKNATTPPTRSPTKTGSPTDSEADTLSAQTEQALAEWQTIYTALTSMASHFGSAMQPLPDDISPAQPSPFGPAIHFMALDIAVLWALYYAAHIVLLRAHPAMPMYALVASSVCANLTSGFAIKLGRIAAGMMPPRLEHPLNPALGATLCEVMVPMFAAGIQYTDADQRAWLVAHALQLEELSGWAAIGMIGQGCEVAWERMGELGKGPVYMRPDREGTRGASLRRMLREPPKVDEIIYIRPEQMRNGVEKAERMYYAMGFLEDSADSLRIKDLDTAKERRDTWEKCE
jgi:hypothetical protein